MYLLQLHAKYGTQKVRHSQRNADTYYEGHLESKEHFAIKQYLLISDVPRNFLGRGGVQQIQLRTEDRENGDLGAVAP